MTFIFINCRYKNFFNIQRWMTALNNHNNLIQKYLLVWQICWQTFLWRVSHILTSMDNHRKLLSFCGSLFFVTLFCQIPTYFTHCYSYYCFYCVCSKKEYRKNRLHFFLYLSVMLMAWFEFCYPCISRKFSFYLSRWHFLISCNEVSWYSAW